MKINRILLIDDDELNVIGTQLYLERKGYQVDIATDMRNARKFIQAASYDAAIIDARLPDNAEQTRPQMINSGGIQLLREIKQRNSLVGAVLFTAYEDRGGDFFELMREGIRGIAYILKGRKADFMLKTLYETVEGKIVVDADVTDAQQLSRRLRDTLTGEESAWVNYALEALPQMTCAERDLAERIAACHSLSYIAETLEVPYQTINSRKKILYQKLGLSEIPDHINREVLLAKVLWMS